MQIVIQKMCIDPRVYINEMAVVKDMVLHGRLIRIV
jgi:hypothetical protein